MTYFPVATGAAAGPIPVQSVVASAATLTLAFSATARETSYSVLLAHDCVITIAPGAAGVDQLMSIDVAQDASGGHALGFANVSWPGGVAPTFNGATGKVDSLQVRAVGADISGFASSMGRVPMIPALPVAPASIGVTPGVGQNTVTAAAVTAYPAVTGYTVKRGVATGAESATPIASNVALPYVDTGLNNGTSYYYTVQAVNAQGVGPASPEGSGTPTSLLPAAPAGTTVSPGAAQNSVNAAAVTATPAVTGYTVYRGTAAGGESSTPVASNVSLPYIDTGLSNGTTYYYRVAAVNSAGTGAQSPEASGTPVAVLPGAPSSITVTAGVGQIVVNAAAVSSTPAVTGYSVYRGTSAGGETGAAVATNVSLPYTDTGLTNGTTYFYKVAAVSSAGTGAQSPEASGTPVSGTVQNATHCAVFSGANQAIYASPNAAMNPGSAAFDMRAKVNMASYAPGGSVETNLWGCWDVDASRRVWRLGLTTDGRVRANWAVSSSVQPTAVSAAVVPTAANTDVWLRAVVTPTSGSVSFYTSSDGSSWTALGGSQAASGSGAVNVPASPPYLVIGQNASASAGAQAEQFVGRFVEARLYIGGLLVTDPVMGPGSTVDAATASPAPFTYGTSSGVAYQ